ncbi:MAG: type IIL restriction-modification enzyme MmeI [Polyangiaceae bacterium]
MSAKMGLRRFALRAAGGFRGREGAEAFARGLIGCFHPNDEGGSAPAGLVFGHSFPIVADGKKTNRSVSAYWPDRRVVVEVVDRDLMLDLAWGEVLRACLQMDTEPQYVVLTNQRDVRLYDLAKDRVAPRLTKALDELPKYSEAFPFFEPEWVPGTTPKIINVDKVSKEVADLVAKVYRALAAKNPERKDDVIRFTLQCIIAMFAEDIGLLPKEYFTTLLYRAAEEGGVEQKLTELFTWMSTPLEERSEPNHAIPYFNGGLFTEAISLALDGAVLRALTKAAEANWSYVDPHIFGSVFQGVMDDAERHASGAHYTAREDIMSVVGPTIVEPWRERIEAASKLEELKAILTDLTAYRVLDPACGSGNFLYVAFRELYRLETEVLVRIYDAFPSATKGKGRVSWASGIRTTNFFGIDNNPFAVELAKTTLNIAKKIAFDQRRDEVVAKFGQFSIDVDPSLPLDNLDENILCADALFTNWPNADAIIGNPPFLGGSRIRTELGGDYLARLQAHFSTGGGDLCAFWFRKAHLSLLEDGRAGLVATSAVRFGLARETSLDFIVANGGYIVDAISMKSWPGDATVNVSVVNWTKVPPRHPVKLRVGGLVHHVPTVHPHLRLHADVSQALPLGYPAWSMSEGIKFGSDAFELPASIVDDVAREGAARMIAAAGDVLAGRLGSPRWALWLADCDSEQDAAALSPTGHRHLKQEFYPQAAANAANPKAAGIWKQWVKRWWQPWAPRDAIRSATSGMSRIIACGGVQSRPIHIFLSTKWIPTNTLQIFAFDDDYVFGVMQSALHWAWTKAKGGRLTDRIRYTSPVWKTFPWPQEPTVEDVVAVAQAGRALRATRDRLMVENGWSLRDLYRAAEVEGPHPLKDAQAKLDAAVEAAYGKPADQEATEFLLEMNLALAEDEAAGETIQGPGLPRVDGQDLDPRDPRWFSTDCIEPPPLPGLDVTPSPGAGDHHG